MGKLNQIIAVVNGRKTQAKSLIEDIFHRLQKKELLQGLVRTYHPKDENGEQLPDERKGVQVVVPNAIDEAITEWVTLCDVVATQDMGNTLAKANITVDGTPLVKDVPVTHLLFLEKQLVDLSTFITKLPTLDPADNWVWDSNAGHYRSDVSETTRTKKVPKAFVKYDATPNHPAQVDVFNEEVQIGTYKLTKFSGAIPAQSKTQYQNRVRKLQEAVKCAREEANSTSIQDVQEGQAIFNYVFNK